MRRFPTPTIPPHRLLLAAVCVAALTLSVACDEQGGTAGSAITLAVDELEVRTECDSATNPGDFYISASLEDQGDRGVTTRYGLVDRQRIDSHIDVKPVDIEIGGQATYATDRTLALAVAFDEHDGGAYYDGSASIELGFRWNPDRGCWEEVFDRDGTCIAPGEALDFSLELDSSGKGKCQATLHAAFEVSPTRRPAAAFAVGEWRGYALEITVTALFPGDTSRVGRGGAQAANGSARCRDGFVTHSIAAGRSPALQGWGHCERGLFNGVTEYELDARFTGSNTLEGTLRLDIDGQTVPIPVSGELEGNTIDWVFSHTTPNPYREIERDWQNVDRVHWMGGFETERERTVVFTGE